MLASYSEVTGTIFKCGIVQLADELIQTSCTGRFSRNDARKLLAAVIEHGNLEEIEDTTLRYLRDNYPWSDAARVWFYQELRIWALGRAHEQYRSAISATDS